ncbi:MAG TPA: HAMP domain-containing sensor histidine kinase [Terriglobales bacterium]|nr:HAMP domain-containing sensor histidine kinase [Terriglobales bacterium]
MKSLRLRTKFLLSMILISSALTCTSLLVVRRTVQSQVRSEIFTGLRSSAETFQNFQRQRAATLARSADLLADLPNMRAQMTTQHEVTIQDASTDLWRLAGSDMFVLANREGRVVALHTSTHGFSRELAQDFVTKTLDQEGSVQWWYGGKHLYEVFLKPIYFGPASENRLLGFLALGYEIDDRVASEISQIAGSQVAFYYGDSIARTTLPPNLEAELIQQEPVIRSSKGTPARLRLGNEQFLATSVDLGAGNNPPVRLSVLKSLDQATGFLESLNRLLVLLGIVAVLGGSLLVYLISHTFTRPLAKLVDGVRALGKGDFAYPISIEGGDEVAEVAVSFDRMRNSLLKSQQRLLEAERLATIGQMASSISHDLRHSLAAIVANAEFLCEMGLTGEQREELYHEVQLGVNQMTELIDSLLEFSRTRESLRPSHANLAEAVNRAVQTIKAHPVFNRVQIRTFGEPIIEGWFDPRKLERVLHNLLLNACESVPPDCGRIEVHIHQNGNGAEIKVCDNGRGIPEAVRDRLFEPFVSFGKENGTGLGLTVVQKIVQDHGGDVRVEKTSAEGTVFKIVLPLNQSPHAELGAASLMASPLTRMNPVQHD